MGHTWPRKLGAGETSVEAATAVLVVSEGLLGRGEAGNCSKDTARSCSGEPGSPGESLVGDVKKEGGPP